ncbi:MAG TPA: cysteine dioxygenase family protein [Dehalococcoidia bacterium]|nr:cysteine dioxygenase family protein [Dehalococcoidia bacterium]
MTAVKYSLDEFIYDMESLLKDQPDQEKIFDQGSSYLSRLISNPETIPTQFRSPVGRGSRPNHGSYLIHQGDSGLLVTAVVWGPGDHASPHDHRTWGMIGVMDNALTETRFRRVDDRTKKEYAQLEKDRAAVVKPGEISLLIPEVDEIHQMDNFTDRPTVEIHVYGHDLRGLDRVRYNLETGRVTSFATKKYDNC